MTPSQPKKEEDKQQEIIEGCKKIVKYMGEEWNEYSTLYYDSWDWLMPVVEKIEEDARVDIYKGNCKISTSDSVVDIAVLNESKKVAVWLAAVQYLDKKNSNP